MSKTGLLTLKMCVYTDKQSRYSGVSTCMCRCDGNMFQPCGSRCTYAPSYYGNKTHLLYGQIPHRASCAERDNALLYRSADATFSRIASITMLTRYLCVSLIYPLDTTLRMFLLIQNSTSTNSSYGYVSNFFNLWSCKNTHVYFSVLHPGQYKQSAFLLTLQSTGWTAVVEYNFNTCINNLFMHLFPKDLTFWLKADRSASNFGLLGYNLG